MMPRTTDPGTTTLSRAGGPPVSTGIIRRCHEDFRVDEYLGFEASGDGPHLLLRVEKTGCNTTDVSRMLAAHAAVPVREVGYSGLKDKHAVCTQWFSVPRSPDRDWTRFQAPGVRVLETGRHRRKLRRGSHRANRFIVRIELARSDRDDLERRLTRIREGGVPNYFGEQRFGRRYAENVKRLAAGGRLPRLQRSMTLSAMRSELFNRVLDRRVREGTWDAALPGEYVNLDGTRSGFPARDDDPAIPGRIASLDLHPTGPLFGRGPALAGGETASLEREVMQDFGAWCDVLARHGLKMERRATRCVARELDWRLEENGPVLELAFVLGRGQFATAVLREVLRYRDVTRTGDDAPSTPE